MCQELLVKLHCFSYCCIIMWCLYLPECNCHDKSEECYHNQTVADAKLSLNIHGEYEGGGVCLGCSENTGGVNCQSCVDGYYRPSEVSVFIYIYIYMCGSMANFIFKAGFSEGRIKWVLLCNWALCEYFPRWVHTSPGPAAPAHVTWEVHCTLHVSQTRVRPPQVQHNTTQDLAVALFTPAKCFWWSDHWNSMWRSLEADDHIAL